MIPASTQCFSALPMTSRTFVPQRLNPKVRATAGIASSKGTDPELWMVSSTAFDISTSGMRSMSRASSGLSATRYVQYFSLSMDSDQYVMKPSTVSGWNTDLRLDSRDSRLAADRRLMFTDLQNNLIRCSSFTGDSASIIGRAIRST